MDILLKEVKALGLDMISRKDTGSLGLGALDLEAAVCERGLIMMPWLSAVKVPKR